MWQEIFTFETVKILSINLGTEPLRGILQRPTRHIFFIPAVKYFLLN